MSQQILLIPEYAEIPRETVEALIRMAYIKGLERAAEICKTEDPHPDQYSDDWEITARNTVLACIKKINTEKKTV